MHKYKWITAAIGVSTFLIIYLAGAIFDSSTRYERAKAISISHAHTRVGIEGYEYIFEPNTHILIDKILPNRNLIITNIVLHDYMPFSIGYQGMILDKDIEMWLRFRIFYLYNQKPVILRLILYASISTLITTAGFYLLSKTYSVAKDFP